MSQELALSRCELGGVEAGVTSGRNGAAHQAVLDLSSMPSIPGMGVFVLCDATETRAILSYLRDNPRPAYMPAPRGKTPAHIADAAVPALEKNQLTHSRGQHEQAHYS